MIVLAHVDGLVALGKPDDAMKVSKGLHTCRLLKEPRQFNDGDKVRLVGRNLGGSGDEIHMRGQRVLREPLEGVSVGDLQTGTIPSCAVHFLYAPGSGRCRGQREAWTLLTSSR